MYDDSTYSCKKSSRLCSSDAVGDQTVALTRLMVSRREHAGNNALVGLMHICFPGSSFVFIAGRLHDVSYSKERVWAKTLHFHLLSSHNIRWRVEVVDARQCLPRCLAIFSVMRDETAWFTSIYEVSYTLRSPPRPYFHSRLPHRCVRYLEVAKHLEVSPP